MNWEKLKKDHFKTDPVEHIYVSTIFDRLEYDILYENQNNLNHHVWKEFDKKYKTGFQFYENLNQINFNKEIIALWFFRERLDRGHSAQINLAGKILKFHDNTFLLTESKDIKIVPPKKQYLRHPFIQLDINREQYRDLVNKLK